MVLQINITPKDERTAESSGKHLKSKDDMCRVLKPFELPTRISMQTFVNTKTEHFLHIRNTNDRTLNVSIIKWPPQERFIELSFTTAFIEANSSVTLKITWSPTKPGVSRDVLQLTDSCRRSYDILLLMDAKVSRANAKIPLNSPFRNFLDSQSESSLDKKPVQSRYKRTRISFDHVIANKENVTNVEHGPFTENAFKKPRREIFSSEKTWGRENYIATRKNLRNLIRIDENGVNDDFDDFLSPPKPKAFSNFSLAIGNINFTPKISSYPDEVFEFSHQDISAWAKSEKPISNGADLSSSTPSRKVISSLKPTRLVQNFKLLSPVTPASRSKTDFASSALLSLDCSNLETSKKIGNTSTMNFVSSTAKEVLEPERQEKKVSSGDKKIFIPEAKILSEIPKPHKLQKVPASKHRQLAEKIKKMPSTKNRKISKSQEVALKTKQLSKSLRKKTLSVPGGRIANRSLAGNRKKANQPLKTEKKASIDHEPNCMIKLVNPDPFAATVTEDPFLSCTLTHDEKWVFLQEMEFKKWLNTLMTAPENLSIDVDSTSVDVGKVWRSCRMKEEVVLAESKESISARYHTNMRLNTLRKAASAMFRKDEVREALSGVTHCIENGSLVFKKDKDPYRDIGLQKEILELFLSYNPLWLRIGLETVYGETIPLQSNNDLIGLTRFLLARFFSDPFILKKHSHPTIVGMKLPTFTSHMNNFVMKKFLQVVYFLDYAKMNKLIGYDPCLFRKNALHKDSRSILLTFSREILSGIGDITKVLRLAGYVVHYKQTYLDEFDYAVNDMSLDLRDGVRLCRTMELIRGKGNLTSYCRVPAVSKLQKIHNVNIALTALLDSGYFLTGQIDAKSIVNGDREKTLSLLWQIIHKFQAPRFEKAATCLQTWWRSKLWYIQVKNFLKKRRNDAAYVIQRAWRCYLAKKKLNQLRVENKKLLDMKKKAARIIQEWWIFRREGVRDRHAYVKTKSAVQKIQRWWRRNQETKPFVEDLRRNYEAVILIQRVWRAKKFMREKKLNYLKLNASRVIQNWWRRVLIVKRDRNIFLLMKHAVWIFEKSWIEKKMIKEEKREFLRKRNSAIVIQRFWRRYRSTKDQVSQLRICRKSSLKIQSWWRSIVVHRDYKMKRKSSLKIQNWWRSLQETKACQVRYSRTKKAALVIQKNWRMVRTMRNYSQIKSAVLRIESWYEGLIVLRSVREEFLMKKNCVKKIENWWKKYLERKSAAVKIQSWFRMIEQKREFANMLIRHKAAVVIQSRWRANLEKRKVQSAFIKCRECVIVLQRKWRATQLVRLKRNGFLDAKKSIIIIQKHWRSYAARKDYRIKREAAIQIQNWWREVLKKKQLEVRKELEFRRTENVVVKIGGETLATTLQKSIYTFLFSNDLGRLSMCLASLDFITRLSASGCITVCKVGLVDKIFMTLVQSNRSLPWMDVCTRASSILITLAKYPPTKPFVLEEKYTETLARLLTVTVEKEVQLFLHLATLMWILLEDSKFSEAVLENSRCAWLLKSLYDTVNRKKYKFAPANPEAQLEVLPNPKPDWGLKQKRPRIFENIVHAVTSISKRLGK